MKRETNSQGTIPGPVTAHLRVRRRRRTRLLGLGALAVLLVLGTSAAIVVSQALSVKEDLQRAADLVPKIQAQLANDETTGAEDTFSQLQQAVRSSAATTSGPLWTTASKVPFIGANFRAVAELSTSLDDIAVRAVEPLLAEYGSLDRAALTPSQGRIDLAPIEAVAPKLTAAAQTVSLSTERISSINLDGVVPDIADPITLVASKLSTVSDSLSTASYAAQLLPPMLGSDSPREYLVLVQNNAETRATGGIPGALAILRADKGELTLGEQSSATELGRFVPPLAVDEEQEALYSSRLGQEMQNVNLTPDFPTAALTAQRMWEQRHPGHAIAGVIALDPVVLSYLLDATGPVEFGDPDVLEIATGTDLPVLLSSDNVVPTLLSDVYNEVHDPRRQDAYFAAVASEVFSAFTQGGSPSTAILDALASSAAEDRLYVWSSNPGEQELISETRLAGAVNGTMLGSGSTFGMYFNDGTGAKMDYHARRTVQLIQQCRTQGYGRFTLRVAVTNAAPTDAANLLPAYVTGNGFYGIKPGNFRTNYIGYGPAQSLLESVYVNGKPSPFASAKHGQRPVGSVTVELEPGQSAEIDFVYTKVIQETEARLSVTPTAVSRSEVVLPTRTDSDC